MSLTRHGKVAESFGSDAVRYDRARPRYPTAMVAPIVAASPAPASWMWSGYRGAIRHVIRDLGHNDRIADDVR